MKASKTLSTAILGILVVIGSGCGSMPDPPVTTLWQQLGIPQAGIRIRDSLINRRGNFPGLEAKPPLLALADPANLESPVEAIKVAAEVKMEEDLKKQKIKALKYLGEIGCGCYDEEGKIAGALLAALEDCSPDVRIAAAEAIAESIGECCGVGTCARTCCTKDIQEKLAEIAYGEEDGCYIEPVEEVREAAMAALCCCPPLLEEAIEDNGNQQQQQEEEEQEGTTGTDTAVFEPAPVEIRGTSIQLGDGGSAQTSQDQYYPSVEDDVELQNAISTLVPSLHVQPEFNVATEASEAADATLIPAMIEQFDSGTIRIAFFDSYQIPVGTTMIIVKNGQEVELMVTESSVGRADGDIVGDETQANSVVQAGDVVNVGILAD